MKTKLHHAVPLLAIGSMRLWAADPVTQQPPPPPTPYTLVETGPHHKLWQRETWVTNTFNGSAHRRISAYQEIATGMSRWSGNQWLDCDPTMVANPTGAQATNTQHQVTFLGNINASGSVSILTPDGKRLTSNVLGLSYSDGTNSVFIAETQNSQGELMQSGVEAIFPNAFDGCLADVIYENSISKFDQTIVLREQLPSPSQWNMDPQATVLQIITEFLNPPIPAISQTANSSDPDDYLDFGAMQMGRGEAFAIGSETNRIPVTKRWVVLSGRQCLVEQIRFEDIEPFLLTLPPRTGAIEPKPGSLLGKASRSRSLPPAKLAMKQTPALKLAKRRTPSKGFALDYSLLTSQTNVTLQADTTYYIAGAVNLSGTNNVIEGGCVLKFTNSSAAGISASSLIWKTAPYRPAVFTSKDDNSLGEAITGSTSNPTTNFYGGTVLDLTQISSPTVANARFSYLSNALAAAGSITLRDVQFVNCCKGFAASSAAPSLCNALLCNIGTFLSADGLGPHHTLIAQNVTAHFCTNFIADSADTVSLTNCLFVCVTNWSCATTYTNSSAFLNSDSGVFQTIGAGTAYLAADSPYRNAGISAIDATLLADLAAKTTYPPIVYASVRFNSPLNLFPQAQRDNDTPDLGYHYDPLDFAFGVSRLTNAVTITFNPGTVVAGFATNELTDGFGLDVDYGGQIVAMGSPLALARFVVYNTVQEQSQTPWVEPYQEGIFTDASSYRSAGGFSFRFCDFSSLAQHSYHMYISTATAYLQDCQFHGGWLVGDTSLVDATNCLFERVWSYFTAPSGIPVFRNNTFFGGEFDFYPSVTNGIVKDNIFDHTVFGFDLTGYGYNGGFNAFVTNSYLYPTNATDIILTSSPAYQTGPLGKFYQLTSSTLFNADTNTTAAQVGLFHYTTITNLAGGYEIKETNSWLDLGMHYVATDSTGNPIDTSGKGVPDYLQDANGNGVLDSGETDWTSFADLGLKVLITRPRGNSVVP